MPAGVTTPSLAATAIADSLVVNRDGGTRQQSFEHHAQQIVSSGAAAAAFAALSARIDQFEGDGDIYPSTSAGLAATTLGQQFRVASSDPDVAFLVYRHDAGPVATLIATTPSVAALADKAAAADLDDLRSEVDPLLEAIQPNMDVPGIVWGVADGASGEVALGVDEAGETRASALQIPGAVRQIKGYHPDYAMVWCDPEGNIAAGIRRDGSGLEAGEGMGEILYTVSALWAEPITDPSRNLYVTWVSNSVHAAGLDYRVRGARSWESTWAVRSRQFPALPSLWLHTAELTGLTPATVYDVSPSATGVVDRIRTSADRDIRLIVASDWQLDDYSPSSRLVQFGTMVSVLGADLAIWNGDMVNDDGRFEAVYANRWLSFLNCLSSNYRSHGAQIPWAFVMGNHEGRNAAGTSNAHTGGNGSVGMIADICSWSYFERHPTRFARSCASLRIGDDLFLTALETDHTVPIMDQFEWWATQMATHAPRVRHSLVIGHVAPFNTYQARYTDQACRDLRNYFWPEACHYSGAGGSLRAWISAHSHNMVVTPRLRMDVRPGESDAVRDNDFYRHNQGLRNIGFGQIGEPVVPGAATLARVSNSDGGPFWDAVLCRTETSADAYEIHGSGVTNPSAPVAHIWSIDLGVTGWEARALRVDGLPYYTIAESI